MQDLATISVIQEIVPIEGKDRIVLATVENYHSIVQKDEFRPGDKVIYVYYDSILPERPEFEFLRKRCWSEKYQGFSADVAASLCLLLSSVFGIPVSTTHTKTSAIMGVGASRRLSAINFSVVRDMMLTWVFTFPGCGLISFLMAKLFLAIF